jgi:hypothetical protein
MFSGKSHQSAAQHSLRLLLAALSCSVILFMGCGGGGAQQNSLPPLMRAGGADFEKYQQLIKIDEVEADEAARPVGDIVMTLRGTVRNFTGRTLNALEVRASVVDLEGKPVKERNVLIIPNRQAELDNNQTMKAQVLLEGISKNATRANIKMEVTGFSFK